MDRDCSEQLNELATALCQAQAEMSDAKKDRQNPHLKSNYATLGSVWDACREPLTKHGLSVVQRVLPGERDRLRLETVLLHNSGQFICGIEDLPLTKPNDPQAYGAALTYARRYGLSAMVGVCPAEDLDNEPPANTSPSGGQRNQQQRSAPQQQNRPAATNGPARAAAAVAATEKPAASMVSGGAGKPPVTPDLGELGLDEVRKLYGETYKRVTGRGIGGPEDNAELRRFTAEALGIPSGVQWTMASLNSDDYRAGLDYLAKIERQKEAA